MSATGDALVLLVSVAAATAVLTAAAIRYARRRALLDLPGRRRSHASPTPRGGGIAIVVAALGSLAWLGVDAGIGRSIAIALGVGLVLVAGIGWIDDHRPLSARARLLVHALAAVAFMLTTTHHAGVDRHSLAAGLGVLLGTLALVSCVNVWNFMDGINGLVTSQSVWFAAILALAFLAQAEVHWAVAAAALAVSALAFLPFNFPRARIFLGDVGSGGLGFACGALALVAMSQHVLDAWALLLLGSALIGDASMTLTYRIVSGRRWYTAHREHLYQWLVRSGRSHAHVTGLYLLWNLIVVLPALLVIQRRPEVGPGAAVLVFGLAAATWWSAKRRVLHIVRRGSRTQ